MKAVGMEKASAQKTDVHSPGGSGCPPSESLHLPLDPGSLPARSRLPGTSSGKLCAAAPRGLWPREGGGAAPFGICGCPAASAPAWEPEAGGRACGPQAGWPARPRPGLRPFEGGGAAGPGGLSWPQSRASRRHQNNSAAGGGREGQPHLGEDRRSLSSCSRESHPPPDPPAGRGPDGSAGAGLRGGGGFPAWAVAGAAPGSHGRRQVPEPRAALPRAGQAAAAAGAAVSPRPPSLASWTRQPSPTGERGQRSAPTCAGSARPAASRLPASPGSARPRPGAPPRPGLSCAPSPSPEPRLAEAPPPQPPAGWAALSGALVLQPPARGSLGCRVQRAPELGEPGERAGYLPAAPGAESTDRLKGPGTRACERPAPARVLGRDRSSAWAKRKPQGQEEGRLPNGQGARPTGPLTRGGGPSALG